MKGKSSASKLPSQQQMLAITILLSLAISFGLYYKVFGQPANFKNGQELAQAKKAWIANGKTGEAPPAYEDSPPVNFWGILHKGGLLVPISMSILLVMVLHTGLRFYLQAQSIRR